MMAEPMSEQIATNEGVSLGIDLAGSEKRSTGIALLSSPKETILHKVVHTDREILEVVRDANKKISIIVIDAPLSLPTGRESLEIRSTIHFRECDRELTRRHYKYFPLTIGPMRMLTARGMRLAAELRSKNYSVYEGYPGASQDCLGIPRKGRGLQALSDGLRSLGLQFNQNATHDELDAITCAYVGWLSLNEAAELIGFANEGQILLPLSNNLRNQESRIGEGVRAKS
jgi:uncharacterized protein